MWFLHSLHCFDDCSFYNFYWNYCLFSLLHGYLINNNNNDDDNNNKHKSLMNVIIKKSAQQNK